MHVVEAQIAAARNTSIGLLAAPSVVARIARRHLIFKSLHLNRRRSQSDSPVRNNVSGGNMRAAANLY